MARSPCRKAPASASPSTATSSPAMPSSTASSAATPTTATRAGPAGMPSSPRHATPTPTCAPRRLDRSEANAVSGDGDYRGLGWAHGCLTVQRLGAMLGPLTFVLADGRQVSPLHIAPWADESGGEALPGVLRRLR